MCASTADKAAGSRTKKHVLFVYFALPQRRIGLEFWRIATPQSRYLHLEGTGSVANKSIYVQATKMREDIYLYVVAKEMPDKVQLRVQFDCVVYRVESFECSPSQ